MRKVVLITLLLVSAVAAATGFVLSRSARAMAVLVNVKDLPEHGLSVVGPAHPSFDGLAATLPAVQADAPSETLRPFSIFIKEYGNVGSVINPDAEVLEKAAEYIEGRLW